MADTLTSSAIKHKLTATRNRMWRLEAFRSFGWAALWLAVGLAVALAGVFSVLPPAIAGFGILGFWIGLLGLVIRGIRSFRAPTEKEAAAAFDAQSEWRPVSSLSDRPAWHDKAGQSLWAAHKTRLIDHVNRLNPPGFMPAWIKADPAWLRVAVPVALLALIGLAGNKSLDRISDLGRPNIAAMLGAESLTVEAWVTPPDYVARAPIFLKTDIDEYSAPVFSDVTLRTTAPSAPRLRVRGETERKIHKFEKTPDGAYEVTVRLDGTAELDVMWWGEKAGWTILAEPDTLPVIAFDEPPVLEGLDRTKFVWSGSDDHGIEQVNLHLTLADPHPGSPNDVSRVAIDLPGVSPTDVSEDTVELDLTRHYWAGAQVNARLEAIDGAGQTTLSELVEVKLPEKLFLRPMARAAQEIRVTVLAEPRGYPGESVRGVPQAEPVEDAPSGWRLPWASQDAQDTDPPPPHAPWYNELEYAPGDVQRASLMLEALTYKPRFFSNDNGIYLGLRSAFSTLNTARSKSDADAVDDLLWAIALKAEYGSAADALAALQAARAALEKALREGASEEEIRRLTDAFRQAAQNYVQARMAEALANGLDAPPPPGQDGAGGGGGGSGFGQGSFEEMLDALSDLTETGATDQARQLLADISQLLENLEFQQGGQGEGDGFSLPNQGQSEEGEEGERSDEEQNLSDALEDLSENLRNQRELNDDTLEANRRGEQGEEGSELSPEALAERQEDIADTLQRLLQRESDRADAAGAGEEDGEAAGALSDDALDQLGQALRDQDEAEEALERGATGLAQQYQERATRNLNRAIGSISEQLDALDSGGAGGEQQTDPFGRDLEEGNRSFGTGDVDLSGEEQRRRAQEVLEELRRRYGEAIDEEEREYLERLLDRF